MIHLILVESKVFLLSHSYALFVPRSIWDLGIHSYILQLWLYWGPHSLLLDWVASQTRRVRSLHRLHASAARGKVGGGRGKYGGRVGCKWGPGASGARGRVRERGQVRGGGGWVPEARVVRGNVGGGSGGKYGGRGWAECEAGRGSLRQGVCGQRRVPAWPDRALYLGRGQAWRTLTSTLKSAKKDKT